MDNNWDIESKYLYRNTQKRDKEKEKKKKERERHFLNWRG
jgi:hypothetical protein